MLAATEAAIVAREFTGPKSLSGQLLLPPRSAVARREIVGEDVRARNLMFLEQPADQRRRSGSLRRSKRVGFAADVFDANGTSVSAHTMIRAISVVITAKSIFADTGRSLECTSQRRCGGMVDATDLKSVGL